MINTQITVQDIFIILIGSISFATVMIKLFIQISNKDIVGIIESIIQLLISFFLIIVLKLLIMQILATF